MDTATLLSTNAMLASAAALIMFVVLRTRKTYPGFGFWTAGVACLALGAAMLVPGALPAVWIVRVLRNALLLAGLLLLLRGMLIFRGLQISYRWDGVAATRAIRQLDAGRAMPIVAMTANAFSEDVARCLAAGMNDFVAKPVDPDNLYSTLLKWLARDSTSGETT